MYIIIEDSIVDVPRSFDVADARRVLPVEPEASLRAELVGELGAAQSILETQIETLRHATQLGGDGSALVLAQNQLAHLSRLAQRIDHANGQALTELRAEVTAIVAATQSTAQQARSAAVSGEAAEVALHAAQAEARRVTGDFLHDYYERKIFDPYLRFASPEDERAYRDREEARLRAIEEARALGTPQGELQALRLAQEQLRDAGRYGAADSPDYQPMLDRIDGAIKPLEQAIAVEPRARQEAEAAFTSTEAALVSPELIATLRATGAVVADPHQTGHGVSTTSPREALTARTV